MKTRRPRINQETKVERKIEFSTRFAKDKNPNWDKNIRSKEGERKVKAKPTPQDKWAEFKAFAATELNY
jgi:hypothetical protein